MTETTRSYGRDCADILLLDLLGDARAGRFSIVEGVRYNMQPAARGIGAEGKDQEV